MTITQRQLGTDLDRRLRPRPRLHGHVRVLRPADEAEAVATIHRALDLGVTFLDTADMYGPLHQRGAGRPGHRRRAATRSCWPPSSATSATPTADRTGIDGTPGVRPPRLRRQPAAARRRPHRPLLPAPGRPDASRSRRRSAPWPSWSQAGKVRHLGLSEASADTIRRAARRAPDHRAADRVLAVDPRPRGRDPARPAASSASASCPTPRSAAASSPAPSPRRTRSTAGDFRRHNPRFQGETLDANLRAGRRGPARSPQRKGCTPGQLALAWVLAQGDDVVPIPGTKRRTLPGGERRRRPPSSSPPTTSPPSSGPSPRRRGRRALPRHVAASTPDCSPARRSGQVAAIPIRPSRKASTNSAWSSRTRTA